MIIAITCGLFNDYVGKSDYISSNDSESQTIKDVQGSGRDKV
jgi:hypothetical protein